MENRNVVAYFANRSKRVRLATAAHQDAAPCDYLAGRPTTRVPKSDKLPELVRTHKPQVIALQFWGFSAGQRSCMAGAPRGTWPYYLRYIDDTGKLVEQVTAAARDAGIRRPRLVWVLQPPDRAQPDRIRRLNEQVFSPLAKKHGDSVMDAGWFASEAAHPFKAPKPGSRYVWHQFLPCTALEHKTGYCTRGSYGGAIMLHPDGEEIRFCLDTVTEPVRPCTTKSAGLVRYSRAIAHAIIQAVAQ